MSQQAEVRANERMDWERTDRFRRTAKESLANRFGGRVHYSPTYKEPEYYDGSVGDYQNPYVQPKEGASQPMPTSENATYFSPQTGHQELYDPSRRVQRQDQPGDRGMYGQRVDQTAMNFAQTARMILNKGGHSQAYQDRLRGIIDQGTVVPAAQRKETQAAALAVWKKITAQGLDPNSGISGSEHKQASDAWRQQFTASALPMPQQYYTAKEEEEDPTILLGNAANTYAEVYGVDEEQIRYQLRIDPKTKTLDPRSVNTMLDRMDRRQEAQSTGSAANQRAVANWGKQLDKQIKVAEESSRLFDERGEPQDRPAPMWGNPGPATRRAQNDYDTQKASLDKLYTDKAQADALIAGFVNPGEAVAPGAQASPPPATAEGVPEVSPYPQTAPYVPKPEDNGAELRAAMQSEADRTSTTLWIQLPSGRPFPIHPSK